VNVPIPRTPGCRPLISARFLCLSEKTARGVEMGGGKKGTHTGNKIKTIFNSQLTTFNMMQLKMKTSLELAKLFISEFSASS
jgi:hypothetical protein